MQKNDKVDILKRPFTIPKTAKIKDVLFSKKVKKRLKNKFFIFVIFPFFLFVLHSFLLSTDRYASSAKIVVKQSQAANSGAFGLSILGAASSTYRDAMLVEEYVYSMEMFEYLDEKMNLISHYKQNSGLDLLAKYWPWYTKESGLEYYSGYLATHFDHESEILSIEVQSFSPEYSRDLMVEIIKKSEQFINGIGQNLAQQQVAFFEGELQRERERMRDAKNNMINFQEENNILSPEAQSVAAVGIVNELMAEKTKLEAERATLLGYMSSSSAEVKTIENRINAINKQLKGQHRDFAGPDPSSLSNLTARYRDYQLDYAFAEDAYKIALKSVETARVESYQKKNFLATVSNPYVPHIAAYPQTAKNLFLAFIILMAVYGIAAISFEIIKENS